MEISVDKLLEALKNNPELKRELEVNIKFILENDTQELTDSYLEDISGGFHLNKRILAGTLLALQALTSVVPANALSSDEGMSSSNATSILSSKVKTKVNYSNILNVLEEKGNSMHPISQGYAFNEVDGMLLSSLSYLPLNCVPAMNSDTGSKDITLSEWWDRFSAYFDKFDKDLSFNDEDVHRMNQYTEILKSKDVDSLTSGRINLLKWASQSPRYKNIKIGNFFGKYVEYKENSKFCEQFAAVTYTLEDGSKVVNFRGTDATLAGWKEDLDLSWSKTIPSQEDALKYLEKIYNDCPNANYVLIGHSKGGNLCQYAAFLLSSKNKEFIGRLDKVLNYDGPGLNNDIISDIEKDVFEEVREKLTNFIPQSSIIGRFLSDTSSGKFICVYSNKEKITDIFGQHDILTWDVAYDYEKSDCDMKFKNSELKILSDFVAQATSSLMNEVDKKNAMSFFVQWIFDFIVRNKISIQGDQTLQHICGNVLYNYFVKGKTYYEMIHSVFNPGKTFGVDAEGSKKFKNVAVAAYKSFLYAYWERHADISKAFGISEEVNEAIEGMVDSGYSFEKICKLIHIMASKVLTWQNIKKIFKKLFDYI